MKYVFGVTEAVNPDHEKKNTNITIFMVKINHIITL